MGKRGPSTRVPAPRGVSRIVGMTLSVDLVRARRRRRQRGRPLRRWGRVAVGIAAALALVIGGAATLAALAFDDLASNLPPVSAVPEFFDPATHAYRPTQFFDRSGQIVLTAGANAEPISLQTPVVDPGLELLIL